MKLAKHLVEKPWGRADLPAIFAANPDSMTGEVWFDDPERHLPLLVKWLFTAERLSIQVHPDDAQARARGLASGKEECWFVVSADEGATLGIGTHENMSGIQLRAAIEDGSIEQLLDWKPVSAGDYFYIPAGTVHAIGAGVTIVEVQQNADITYRLFDYGRPRELHLEDGVAVSRARPYDMALAGHVQPGENPQLLVNALHFRLYHASGSAIARMASQAPQAWITPLAGTIAIGEEKLGVGECACTTLASAIAADEDATALVAHSLP